MVGTRLWYYKRYQASPQQRVPQLRWPGLTPSGGSLVAVVIQCQQTSSPLPDRVAGIGKPSGEVSSESANRLLYDGDGGVRNGWRPGEESMVASVQTFTAGHQFNAFAA